MSKIRIVNGPYRGREKTLGEKAVTIGRDAEAGIQILDRSASRFHAEIFPVGGMFFVRDLDSKNGTYVNDDRLTDEELLRENDVIKIGTTEMIFESGTALTEDDSSRRIAYQDDPDVLSNTLEFRIDELSDIDEIADDEPVKDNARSLRILYQVGRILSAAEELPDQEVRVLDFLVTAMPAESALIFRREASGKLTPTAVRTSGPQVHPVISRSIIKKTFSENKALHSANAQEDERFERNASIMQKGINSVICVPLTVGGETKGVLYLSRGAGAEPFDQIDLELISACAVQVGMAQHNAEQQRRHRASMWKLVSAMILALEARTGREGAGERCARSCVALAAASHLSQASSERLRRAGMLHHFDRMCADDPAGRARAFSLLEHIPDLDGILPLVRLLHEQRDLKAVDRVADQAAAEDQDQDVEGRILAVAAAFASRTGADPGSEPTTIIAELMRDPTLDPEIAQRLHSCHLDGSLYAMPTDG
jgi:hypothetical protein